MLWNTSCQNKVVKTEVSKHVALSSRLGELLDLGQQLRVRFRGGPEKQSKKQPHNIVSGSNLCLALMVVSA